MGKPIRAAPYQVQGTRVAFNQSTAGTFEAVAAQGEGVKIRIVHWVLCLGAANTLTWKSATTAISSAYPLPTSGVWECSPPYQQFETAANEALNLTLGSAQAVQGDIWYEVIPS